MPQIIVCEWRIIFSERLLQKIGYPIKDPWALLWPHFVKMTHTFSDF